MHNVSSKNLQIGVLVGKFLEEKRERLGISTQTISEHLSEYWDISASEASYRINRMENSGHLAGRLSLNGNSDFLSQYSVWFADYFSALRVTPHQEEILLKALQKLNSAFKLSETSVRPYYLTPNTNYKNLSQLEKILKDK